MDIRFSRDLNMDIRFSRDLLMNIRLSWDLNINIRLGWNLNMDIRLSKRICTGVCNGGIIRPSIQTSNRSYSSTNRLSSITNRGSNWRSSIAVISSIASIASRGILSGGNGQGSKNSNK